MSTSRVVAPPEELVEACDMVDEAAGLVMQDVFESFESLGTYESDIEARILLASLLRHLEALLECARIDLALLPAANTITRSALELGVKIRWLLHPSDAYAREARFLAHLSDEERMGERCDRIVGQRVFGEHSATLRTFREAIEALLPAGIRPLSRIPNLETMMREIGETRNYATYTILSQYTHGSHYAGSVYRRNLGSMMTFGERTSLSDWAFLVEISWWSLFAAGQTIERVCPGRELRSVGSARVTEIDAQLSRLKRETA